MGSKQSAVVGIDLFIFANKLKRLYSVNNSNGKIEYMAGLCGRYFMFDSLYDYLIEQGHKIEIASRESADDIEAKKLLWAICKSNAKQEPNYTKEYATKLYKSELVYLWLVQKYNLEGQQMRLGVPILNWDEQYESNIKNYLEQLTINLTI